jgi:hypothetical protein
LASAWCSEQKRSLKKKSFASPKSSIRNHSTSIKKKQSKVFSAASSPADGTHAGSRCDAYLNESASIGSPGVDNIRWLKPVRPGDTLRAERVILESRASSSKADIGIVKSRWEMFNQHDELVMSMEGISMFKRRAPAPT